MPKSRSEEFADLAKSSFQTSTHLGGRRLCGEKKAVREQDFDECNLNLALPEPVVGTVFKNKFLLI